MRIAILGMISTSIIFCFFISRNDSSLIITLSRPIFIPPDKILSSFQPKPIEKNKSVIKVAVNKKISSNQFPPKIEKNINKIPATVDMIQPSFTGNSNLNVDLHQGLDSSESAYGGGLHQKIMIAAPIKIKKSLVLDNADIMPQYPGGTKALLAFLKKNIHAPEDIEEGEDATVKIKFVIDYDGKMEGFTVIQSAGKVFDDEVLRVLQMMQVWIPGKSNGENVSVYYIVPIKFTKEFY